MKLLNFLKSKAAITALAIAVNITVKDYFDFRADLGGVRCTPKYFSLR